MKHLALALALTAFVGVSFAQSAPAAAASTASVMGKVSAIDAAKNTIEVDAAGKKTSIATDAKTKVTVAGKAATLADVKVGADVEVKGNPATEITVK